MPTQVENNKGATYAQGGKGNRTAFKQTINPRLRGFKAGVERGTIWLVRIIESGESLNGPIYTEEALQAAVPVFEGSPVYLYKWGDADPKSKDLGHLPDEVVGMENRGLVGNLVGSLEGVHWNEQAKSLDGYLKVYDSTLRSRMLAAYDVGDIGEGGARDVFGLSIDATGDKAEDGRTVTRITSANSVDVVTSPAAGGRIRRLVAAVSGEKKEAKPDVPTAHLTEADVSVGSYKHPEQGDGWAVFVAGKPTDWYPDEDRARRAAEIKDRLALTEAKDEESPVPTAALKENAAKVAAELKKHADMLSTASDDEVGAVLQSIADMIATYMNEMGGMDEMGGRDEMATGKHAEKGQPYGDPNNMDQGPYMHRYQAAQAGPKGDEFARMAAGLEEALKNPAVQADSSLRESLENALGRKLEEDEKDVQIRKLEESLREQAINFEANRLAEELGIHDLDSALVLIDRTGVRVSEDYKRVEGLKEAFGELLKEKPYFGKAWTERQTEADDKGKGKPAEAAAAKPAASPAPAPAPAPAATAVKEAEGEQGGERVVESLTAVRLRESYSGSGGAIDEAKVAKRMTHLRRRMLKGDTKAAVEHKKLRQILGH